MATLPLWLADYQLLAAALLLGVMLAIAVLRQPAQRLAVAKSTLAALAGLAFLCALPGWSLVHLLSEPSTPIESIAPTPIETPALAQSNLLLTPPNTSTNITPLSPSIEPSAPSQPAAAPAKPINWPAWFVAVYATGSAAVTLWLITGAFLARRVRQQATPAPLELQELLQQICGVAKQTPQLLISDHIAAPVALGIRRPTILLPSPPPSQGGARGGIPGAACSLRAVPSSNDIEPPFPIQHSPFSLPPSQLLPILAHEWAHLQHRDLHTLAATRLLLILLWPQPLYWLLRRTIRLDQETLADAAAADRAGRLDYAQQLLAWASSASTQRPPRLAGAVGLWEGPSQLKRRIALLLNEQFNVMRSCSTGWRRLCIALLAFAALALSLVTLQPSPVAGSDTPTPAVPEPAPAPADDNAGPAEPNVYAGVCVDEQDRPLSGVDVSLFVHGLIFFENGAPESIEPVAVATTDDAGTFRIENIAELVKHRGLDGPSKQVTIIAQAKGRATAGKHEMLYFVAKRGKTSLLRMPPAATMSGRITDVAGEPISEALVASGSGSYYIPHQGLNTRTDAEGRYRLDSLTPNAPGALAVRHPNHVSTYVTFPSLPTELNVKLRRGSVIKGRVVYQSLDPNLPPSPAAGIRVWAAGVRPPDDGVQREEIDNEADGKPRAVTDADGRYELRGLAGLKYDVNCWSLDHVTAGLQDIEIGRPDDLRESGRTVQVPDMVLTDGAIVRIKLIDAGSSNPLPVKAGTQAFITPRRTSRADAGYSVQLSANVNEKSEAEIRLPAGRYTLSALIRAVADDPAWTSASDKITTASGEADFIEIKEGETVEVTVPMHSHFPSDINDLDSRPLWGKVQAPRYVPQQADADTSLTPAPPWASPTMPSTDAPVTLATGDKAPAASDDSTTKTPATETRHRSIGQAGVFSVVGEPQKLPAYKPNAFTVRAVDSDAKPLSGVEVLLYRTSFADGVQQHLATATTNEHGETEFSDLVPAEQIEEDKQREAKKFVGNNHRPFFLAVLKRPGFTTATVSKSSIDVGQRGAKRTVIMRPAAALSGRVTDPQGNPVAGATVAAGGMANWLAIPGVNAVTTNDDGEFRFDDRVAFARAPKQDPVASAALDLKVNSNEIESDEVPLDPAKDQEAATLIITHPDFAMTSALGDRIPGEVNVQLRPAASIRGRVLDYKSGAPVAGIPIHAWGMPPLDRNKPVDPSKTAGHSAHTTTDAIGEYELKNLPAGRYDLWAEPTTAPFENRPWTSRGISAIPAIPGNPPTKGPDLIVGPPPKLRVQLVNAETGAPIQLKAGASAQPFENLVGGPQFQNVSPHRVDVTTDGVFEMEATPGKLRLGAFVYDGEQKYPPAFQTDDSVYAAGEVLDLRLGETKKATLKVYPGELLVKFRELEQRGHKLMAEKKFDEAIEAFSNILRDHPANRDALIGRGYAYRSAGDFSRSIADFEAALANSGDDQQAEFMLADLLATSPVEGTRNGRRALGFAQRALADERSRHQYDTSGLVMMLEIIAAAYAETADFHNAMAAQREAIELAPEVRKAELRQRLELYQSNKPFRREAPLPSKNEAVKKPANQGASTDSNSRTPFWSVPTSTDLKLTITGVPPAEADRKAIDARVPENETWRLLLESALKVSNPTTLQESVK